MHLKPSRGDALNVGETHQGPANTRKALHAPPATLVARMRKQAKRMYGVTRVCVGGLPLEGRGEGTGGGTCRLGGRATLHPCPQGSPRASLSSQTVRAACLSLIHALGSLLALLSTLCK